MRAVRVSGARDVAVVDVPEPEAVDGEILVEVEAAGICSTDRKFVSRDPAEPRVLGHEIAGRLADGTRVGVHPEIVCDRCDACSGGWHNRCPYRRSLGLDRDGGLAEVVAVPARQVLPVDDLDPLATVLLEPLACVMHAVATSEVPKDAGVVVIGAGTMGLLLTWVLQTQGCRVVVVQRSVERRGLALDLGADGAVGPDDDPVAVLGARPQAIFVTAPGAQPLRWALEQVAVGGLVNAFAGTPDGAAVDANLVHYRHLRLVGSTGSRLRDYVAARDLVTEGAIDPTRLPHRVLPIDEVPEALVGPAPPGVLKTFVTIEGSGDRPPRMRERDATTTSAGREEPHGRLRGV